MSQPRPEHGQMFERRDVWTLSEEDPWHPIIEWYARAVAAMQARDGANFSDPRQLALPRRDPRC
jgi:hypothetical protein